jgi:hypothetical protein
MNHVWEYLQIMVPASNQATRRRQEEERRHQANAVKLHQHKALSQ